MMQLRDIAVRLATDRLVALATMRTSEETRMRMWLGKSDEQTEDALRRGLTRLITVMKELRPENFVRYDDETGKTFSCVPVPDTGLNDASVCKPDSANRMIYFYSHFCTLPNAELRRDCKLKVLIHECTHFVDAFDSLDITYGTGRALEIWTRGNEDRAMTNADNITCYISHFEGVDLSGEIRL